MGKNKKNKSSRETYVPFPHDDRGNRCRNGTGNDSRTTSCDGQRNVQNPNSDHELRVYGASGYDYQRKDQEERKCESRGTHEGSDRHHKGSKEQSRTEPVCKECQEKFTQSTRLPRILPCGHTHCCVCLSERLKSAPDCPQCKRPFGEKKDLASFFVNIAVRNLVEENSTVTVGSHAPMEDAHGRARNRDWPPSERSPHDSRCLEAGIMPLYYCALCLKWVCEKCGNIDHSQQKCHLIPKKEALGQMSKAQRDEVKAVREKLESTVTELKEYKESLDSFSLAMQAAFEAVATEKKRVREMEEENLKKIKGLDAAVEALPNAKNLPDALEALHIVEDQCRTTLDWQKGKSCEILDVGRVFNITKEILISTVFMKSSAEKEATAFGQVLAQHCINGVPFYSQLEAVGGRILVHALRKVDTVPMGSRAIALNSILRCVDKASSLTFLDIGWNGSVIERVFVRLIGDTLRGRQFSALCTGMFGPSFRETGFHRIWWKGLPGEHMWGGDYEKGNGSSGTSLLHFMEREKDSIPHGLALPITPGLVAGRYEETNVSSVFRIYTRGHKNEGEKGAYGGYSSTTEGGKDEAGFGYVEHGLNVLQDALRLGNIKDIKIFNCGIVMETNPW